jgi:hypothetical protein
MKTYVQTDALLVVSVLFVLLRELDVGRRGRQGAGTDR